MPTVSKIKFTESVSGCPVLVAATAAQGTIIHSATTSTGNVAFDEIWGYAQNNHTATATLTVEYGSSAATNKIVTILPINSGLVPIIPGLILNDSSILRAFASVTNVISIVGYANRITD
jgi:hypothetical protein